MKTVACGSLDGQTHRQLPPTYEMEQPKRGGIKGKDKKGKGKKRHGGTELKFCYQPGFAR